MSEFKKGDRVEALKACNCGNKCWVIGDYGTIDANNGISVWVIWDKNKSRNLISVDDLRLITEKTYTKADLNTAMLFKLGKGVMAYYKTVDGGADFVSKKCGDDGCEMHLFDLKDDLNDKDGDTNYDIIAIKQLKNQLDAYNAVKSNTEPTEWDWVREDKPEPKQVEFMEAVRASADGYWTEVHLNGKVIKYRPSPAGDGDYKAMNDMQYKGLSTNEILYGTWYIMPKED